MIRRVRMARKRLAIARERQWATYFCVVKHGGKHRMWRYLRTKHTLRAIERRKEKTS